MSAELISIEEWQKAKFLDWSDRYIAAMLSQMTPRQQRRLIQMLKEAVADKQQ